MKNEKGDDYKRYHVKKIDYRDIYGNPMWMCCPDVFLRRLHAIGEEIVQDHVHYKVERVAVVDDTQHVNLRCISERVTCPPNRDDILTMADSMVLKWWNTYGHGATEGESYRALVRVVVDALERKS